jgi:hypothetical protein
MTAIETDGHEFLLQCFFLNIQAASSNTSIFIGSRQHETQNIIGWSRDIPAHSLNLRPEKSELV